MDIRISGRNVDLGDAFRDHVAARLEAGASKYFSRSLAANVTLSKEHHMFQVDCTLHANQGVSLKSRGEAGDAYAAFDDAAEKIEKQLRRYKRRLKNHHHAERKALSLESAANYVLAAVGEGEEEETDKDDQPIIIAETRTDIPVVSVGDAVMLMNLADAPAFMFRNSRSNALNVVYRRPDGNIGWIDPSPASK
ncbi:MAG: ribosome hibernation-promoting factor, HPF/YfiA family [Pseudomonadota bacterium]